jgi:hypothetical protein
VQVKDPTGAYSFGRVPHPCAFFAQGWESMNTQADNSILPLRRAEPQDIADPAQRGQHRVQL